MHFNALFCTRDVVMKTVKILTICGFFSAGALFAAADNPISVFIKNASGADVSVGIAGRPLQHIAKGVTGVVSLGRVAPGGDIVYQYKGYAGVYEYTIDWQTLRAQSFQTLLITLNAVPSWRGTWTFVPAFAFYDAGAATVPFGSSEISEDAVLEAEVRALAAEVNLEGFIKRAEGVESPTPRLKAVLGVAKVIKQKLSRNEALSGDQLEKIQYLLSSSGLDAVLVVPLMQLLRAYSELANSVAAVKAAGRKVPNGALKGLHDGKFGVYKNVSSALMITLR